MDVRIGITQVARELLVELPDDTDRESLRSSIGALGGAVDTLALTDRRARHHRARREDRLRRGRSG